MSTTPDIEPLFRAHYRALCLFALHYVGDVAAAEDVVMDCFVRLVELYGAPPSSEADGGGRRSPFFGGDRGRSYLYKMVRNASVDYLRQKGTATSTVGAIPLDAVIDVTDTTAEEEQLLQERSEREARLWAAIDRLPKACRNVLLMSKRDGLKNREIAEALGISIKTVEAQLTKAYNTLRGKAREIYMLFF